MAKKHLKRLDMPKTWQIKRKGIAYVARPKPGPHNFKLGLPLTVMLRDIMKIAKTKRDVKNILNNNEVLVDGVRRKDGNFIIGFMDSLAFPSLKEYYRVLLDKKGRISVLEIDGKDANLKICKITGKMMSRKGLQLNFYDGKNILVEKDNYKVGDSVLLEVPGSKIKESIKLEGGSLIVLIGGKHSGKSASIESIEGNNIKCKSKEEIFYTLKKYAFVVGKEKPIIKVQE
ncbi:MAG: 30S ribosomal protein S4e [Nanoarchaeota archaeon]|nr:30S ribosomal protein S4e [Nanoarchaeota archaeon]